MGLNKSFDTIDVSSVGEFTIEDDGTELLRVEEDGPVKVKNANLDLSSTGRITNLPATGTGNGALSMNFDSSTDNYSARFFRFNDANGDDIALYTDRSLGKAFQVYNIADGNPLFEVNDKGPVKVKNSNLNCDSSVIFSSSGGRIKTTFNNSDLSFFQGETRLATGGGGSGTVYIRDRANSQNLFVANEGGPVEVKNANHQMDETGRRQWKSRTGAGKAYLFVNSSGEIRATDENSNTTTLT